MWTLKDADIQSVRLEYENELTEYQSFLIHKYHSGSLCDSSLIVLYCIPFSHLLY